MTLCFFPLKDRGVAAREETRTAHADGRCRVRATYSITDITPWSKTFTETHFNRMRHDAENQRMRELVREIAA